MVQNITILLKIELEDQNHRDSISEYHHQNMMTMDSLLEVDQGTEIYLIYSLTMMKMNQMYLKLSKIFLLRKLEVSVKEE